ncbi:MAG: transposase [Bacteroidales bacterium]|nr:transposase [Bacteroidales bacterium]
MSPAFVSKVITYLLNAKLVFDKFHWLCFRKL